VKAPLIFSLLMGIIASVVTVVVSTGGSDKAPRWDLGAIAFGIAFIVTLVVAAMLSMSYKENAEHLGKGSGINLSSSHRHKDAPAQGNDDGGAPSA
jgi:preprotein translocase subunit SecY